MIFQYSHSSKWESLQYHLPLKMGHSNLTRLVTRNPWPVEFVRHDGVPFPPSPLRLQFLLTLCCAIQVRSTFPKQRKEYLSDKNGPRNESHSLVHSSKWESLQYHLPLKMGHSNLTRLVTRNPWPVEFVRHDGVPFPPSPLRLQFLLTLCCAIQVRSTFPKQRK